MNPNDDAVFLTQLFQIDPQRRIRLQLSFSALLNRHASQVIGFE
jgi:hypothetical protein